MRELKNLVERLVILGPDDSITAADIEAQSAPPAPPGQPLSPRRPFKVLADEAERAIIEEALAHHGGQMTATARALGLERSHLYKKAKALGLRGESDKSERVTRPSRAFFGSSLRLRLRRPFSPTRACRSAGTTRPGARAPRPAPPPFLRTASALSSSKWHACDRPFASASANAKCVSKLVMSTKMAPSPTRTASANAPRATRRFKSSR